MLEMVEAATKKKVAQITLKRTLRGQLKSQGLRNIGFPGGNVSLRLFSNGPDELWVAFRESDDDAIPKFWNACGVFDPQRHSQNITVEMNIPIASNSALVAGFFARDPETDHVYLMHDGSIGGGKAGVGRNAFLAWSKEPVESVSGGAGAVRAGIVIGRVDSVDIVSRLWRFVKLVRDFKGAVGRGELGNPEVQRAISEWEKFKPENPGRRRGRRRSDIDYVSYHGDIVNMLRDERNARCMNGESVFNNQLIDLYVKAGQTMTEIYEVKTNLDRQSIYTAIGQLLSHSFGASPNVRRTLVLPKGKVPADLEEALTSLSIKLRRFSISSGEAPKITLL
jgi:hypothetical protein